MQKVLTHNFIQITLDACLKAFWRKKALRRFLTQQRISEILLVSWPQDESKRDFLDRLFEGLIKQGPAGHQVILEMARSLAEFSSFPDLENWEDSTEMISSARQAVQILKNELEKLNQQVKDEKELQRRKEETAQRKQQVIQQQQTLEKLESRLNDLAARLGSQKAGYDFESWFYELTQFFEIESRRPYKVDGRQFDGSMTLDGTTYLIELKFTSEPTGSPEIDIFDRKVSSKADNTMGIFVSMSGYNDGAIKTASRERTPLLLLDGTHIYSIVLREIMSLPDVIRRVKRHAAQTGNAFLPSNQFSG
ncbi:MAG: restriction endonuclease [Magnetococcales bacterium]|nr:restriction endonuclease [Magnetococcales bacterium]MBF0149822.1 restriction endonuclease [Magnetococcales bacterium]